MISYDLLPAVFAGLTAFSVLMYAILDGYDLGVGILLPMDQDEATRDKMIASIGPFWDANETWLVLAVGLLLIAFPAAHSVILFELYLPAAILLIGLIMRGVAFDFRAKAAIDYKRNWDRLFKSGSVISSFMQGYMLGMYITGFDNSFAGYLFSVLTGIGVIAAYGFIGAAWLVMKTEGELQKFAIKTTQIMARLAFLNVILISVVNVYVNPRVFDKWFEFPLVMFVLFIPITCVVLFIALEIIIKRLPKPHDRHCWLPFVLAVGIFILCFSALAFSFYPYIVPNQLTIWQAASAPESLNFIFNGAVIVIPVILAYTFYAYRVFNGKVSDLKYH
ncbi:cytochrome d ubiquinol oxidase subunit II [Algibacillus agarilyticus]|uniref:cytochrome d ubiquinol oxidase subunit II n=1 Tax=Algibacillus agarilyticus TaxID=2234133 RepID=UPI000DCFA46A|nr:cytochrome d ubiquinol oxidase subunit II [Algibacillus agarilyticus]